MARHSAHRRLWIKLLLGKKLLLPLVVRKAPPGLRAPQLALKFFDLQSQQAVELAQLLVFLLENPDLFGGCDHSAECATERLNDKQDCVYLYLSYVILSMLSIHIKLTDGALGHQAVLPGRDPHRRACNSHPKPTTIHCVELELLPRRSWFRGVRFGSGWRGRRG